MAENGVRIGLRNLHYKLLTVGVGGAVTYGAPTKIKGLISGTLTPQTTEGELYADDELSEFHSSISAFDVTIGVKDIPLEDRAKLLGYPISEDGRMRVTSNAVAPLVAISFEAERTDGKYQYVQVHKVRFAPVEESYETKGGSIVYQTVSITGKALPLDGHDAFYDTIIKESEDPLVGEAWHNSTTLPDLTEEPVEP